MHSLTLTTDNRADVAAALAGPRWTVACLCALWCGTCGSYRATFEELAARHPDTVFVWVDIEDQADVVGDLDIDNFPTLLIQHEDNVAFFGTVLPDGGLAHRMVQAQQALSGAELAALAASTQERRDWQRDCNLRNLLAATLA
ncbi:thioredoxin family protein [Janthinobacterium lividum]|uniref:Thioredoxin family protein n=2 Tax=Oxalobacteraceae TaxID=75682 RepID=A0ABU0XRL5_9BURK|nr:MULTISPECIES: thioredoxin family protein [Janthinobacterium]KHA79996.1 thioredoxin [Janthinobacterium lividum]MCC7711927.1 thioredoxin family protein [Janthinobacterium lividum]MDQ4625599.1 thioredoxin family protein [Janthinobacterium lividum]MDQ4672798.1 thioredoxin family protein [Janthinobacterium lividum]MDQ4683526.1 thioredoxin family protein [Janthinobacterium lividum]